MPEPKTPWPHAPTHQLATSAAWFERTASPAQVKTIYRFKTEKLQVPDDFDPAPDWRIGEEAS